jgi:DNA-binding NtrC family response regulator
MNSPCCLLLVDDDCAFRSALRRMLRMAEPQVAFALFEAGCGAEAEAILRGQPVDCVLLDHHMPGGNGVEWVPRFRAARPAAGIVMITGGGDEETAVLAMKSGAMDYLVKGSIAPLRLASAVSNVVEKLAMQGELERQRRQLVEAERQRVMVESLGAACHHLGQPATVIATCLHMIRKGESDPARLRMLDECVAASDAVCDILRRLLDITAYRTEPYRPRADVDPPRPDEHILAL